jgi:hypothetical protein
MLGKLPLLPFQKQFLAWGLKQVGCCCWCGFCWLLHVKLYWLHMWFSQRRCPWCRALPTATAPGQEQQFCMAAHITILCLFSQQQLSLFSRLHCLHCHLCYFVCLGCLFSSVVVSRLLGWAWARLFRKHKAVINLKYAALAFFLVV